MSQSKRTRGQQSQGNISSSGDGSENQVLEEELYHKQSQSGNVATGLYESNEPYQGSNSRGEAANTEHGTEFNALYSNNQMQDQIAHQNYLKSVQQMAPSSAPNSQSLTSQQLYEHQLAMASIAQGLPIHVIARISLLPPQQQQQFHLQHQLYLQRLQQFQLMQAQGHTIPPQQLQMLQQQQQILTMLVNGVNLNAIQAGYSPYGPTVNTSVDTGAYSNNSNSYDFQNNHSYGHPVGIPGDNNIGNPNISLTSLSASHSGASSATSTAQQQQHAPLKIPLPPWLHSTGEKKHSEQQLSTGMDLSKTKRKYRLSSCLYCAQVYPQSPWAQSKSRKFEHEIFRKHEKSNLHQRALLELNKSALERGHNSLNPMMMNVHDGMGYETGSSNIGGGVDGSSMQYSNDNGGQGHGHEQDLEQRMHLQHTLEGMESESNDRSGRGGQYSERSNESAVNAGGASGGSVVGNKNLKKNLHNYHLYNADNSAVNTGSGKVTSSAQSVGSADVQSSQATAPFVEPEWLEYDGDLVHSDMQVSSGRDLTTIRKRYRRMLCTFCAHFNPTSPWAVYKARLYDSDTVLEHANSHGHNKALIQRDLFLTAQGVNADNGSSSKGTSSSSSGRNYDERGSQLYTQDRGSSDGTDGSFVDATNSTALLD